MPTRITPAILNIIILNAIVFVAVNMLHPEWLEYIMLHKSNFLGFRETVFQQGQTWLVEEQDGQKFVTSTVDQFSWWQIFTSWFTHGGLLHIFFNMFALASIGTLVEMVMKTRRFVEFYVFCGVVSAVLIAFLDPSNVPVLGASGALSGVLVAFGYYFPEQKLYIFFIPYGFEAKKLVMGFAAISAILVILKVLKGFDPVGISHFGHLMGMVAAFIYIYLSPIVRRIVKGE